MAIYKYKKNLDKLTKLQFEVTQNNATEPSFNNKYWDNNEEGIYVDITTGEPLFLSINKFDSFSGWPSFTKPIKASLIAQIEDNTLNTTRTEVRSTLSDAHLGHVFTDGPKEEGGLRYCINSAALDFIPEAELTNKGYAKYLEYFTINISKAYLAGGCFWGIEHYFSELKHVTKTRVGYMGGKIKNPTYEIVKEGNSNHAEAVEISFMADKISYKEILKYFLQMHDPMTENRQGNDIGSQYRSAIFYLNEEQKRVASALITEAGQSGVFPNKIVTELVKAEDFFEAEKFHQQYLKRNPNGYNCHFIRDGWKF